MKELNKETEKKIIKFMNNKLFILFFILLSSTIIFFGKIFSLITGKAKLVIE